MSQEFKKNCEQVRSDIESLKKFTRENMMDCVVECGPEELSGVRADVKIAYLHLEDARIRLGKAIQTASGGVSIYDQKKEDDKLQAEADRHSVKQEEPPVVANEVAGEDD